MVRKKDRETRKGEIHEREKQEETRKQKTEAEGRDGVAVGEKERAMEKAGDRGKGRIRQLKAALKLCPEERPVDTRGIATPTATSSSVPGVRTARLTSALPRRWGRTCSLAASGSSAAPLGWELGTRALGAGGTPPSRLIPPQGRGLWPRPTPVVHRFSGSNLSLDRICSAGRKGDSLQGHYRPELRTPSVLLHPGRSAAWPSRSAALQPRPEIPAAWPLRGLAAAGLRKYPGASPLAVPAAPTASGGGAWPWPRLFTCRDSVTWRLLPCFPRK